MRTRTKLTAGFNASVLIGGALVLLAGAAPASAHTPEVEATCSELTVALENYTPDAANAAPNNIVVTLDGKEIASEYFGSTFDAKYTYDGTTVGHEYTVVIDAIGTAYDKEFAGKTEVCPVTEEPPVVVPPAEEPPVETPPTEEPPVVVPPTENPPVETPPVETPPVETPPVETPPTEEPPVETPPVEPPVTTTPPAVELPPTGADTGWALPLAGALLLGGIALMFVRRAGKA